VAAYVRIDYAAEITGIFCVRELLYAYAQRNGCIGYQFVHVYGEVSSVKNATINIWLNDGVY